MIPLLPVMLMASDATRCADASLCPDNRALVDALHDFENRLVAEMGVDWEYSPNVRFPTILSVRDVKCGEPNAKKPATVRCVYTIVHRDSTEYEVGELTRKDGRWSIGSQMNVYIPRK